jgi:hypothetical protein
MGNRLAYVHCIKQRTKRVETMKHNFSSLLAQPLSNPKVAKNGKLGVLTAPMHLAPASLSGFNVCPMASAGCKAACLNTAGNPAYAKGKRAARKARTLAFFTDRPAFMARLVREIAKHERQAARLKMACGVRLNATSDIRWETVPCERDGVAYANVMLAFPDIQFYDYTKIANRRNLPANYHLTFSLAENNDKAAKLASDNGMNVAVAFNVKRNHPLPKTFAIAGKVLPVIDGDLHDYRPADQSGCIVGLRAKGKAIGEKSGFVRAA